MLACADTLAEEKLEKLADRADDYVTAAATLAFAAGGNGGQYRTVAAEWAVVAAALRDIAKRTE
jgi:hypothetical protein